MESGECSCWSSKLPVLSLRNKKLASDAQKLKEFHWVCSRGRLEACAARYFQGFPVCVCVWSCKQQDGMLGDLCDGTGSHHLILN